LSLNVFRMFVKLSNVEQKHKCVGLVDYYSMPRISLVIQIPTIST
jgi:hypothetical protein